MVGPHPEPVASEASAMPPLFLTMLVGWCALWALAIGIVLIGAVKREGGGLPPATAAFGAMTLFWIAIDLAIAGWAVLAPVTDVAEFRQLLLINGGLDVLYLATGAFLISRPKSILRGFGLAILVQGGFLLILDLGWWWWLAP